ncbi:MAG: hypothetical protein ACRC14_14615 [Paracoccaceae bacterium]
MRHDWIFDVLTDLKAYALANGMVSLARKTDEALDAAREEIRRAERVEEDLETQQPKDRRTH